MTTKDSLIPCNFVIFGGNGDLAIRKLLPAIYRLIEDGHIADDTRVIGASRSDLGKEKYQENVLAGLKKFIPDFKEEIWENLKPRLQYCAVDAASPKSFDNLKKALGKDFKTQTTTYYLSTAPDLFGTISEGLKAKGLIRECTRVVLEKPIGKSLETSYVINDSVADLFPEDNIYRIDHYLGKETVQNLMSLRFANSLFEPLWTSAHIDNVQITISEAVGAEGRWSYYDESGALRDMVQNHMLQLLCLVAMEVPISLDADSIRAEKLKVLKSLKIMNPQEVEKNAIRAQYNAGTINGERVVGYREEEGGNTESETETFVAIRADVHNWRWRGVPFYIRTGKRMPERYSEIVIEFKKIPHSIFPGNNLHGNKLVIRLQPEESIQLEMMNKVPGLDSGAPVHPVALNLSLPDKFKNVRVPEAYERLIYDVIDGNSTLYVHREEVEAAWVWADAILDGWKQSSRPPHSYAAGSWGPQSAFELVARYGRSWHETD